MSSPDHQISIPLYSVHPASVAVGFMSAGPTIAVAVVISVPVLAAPSIKIIMALPSVFNSATKSCAFCGTNTIVCITPSSKSNCVVDCVSKQAGYVRV